MVMISAIVERKLLLLFYKLLCHNDKGIMCRVNAFGMTRNRMRVAIESGKGMKVKVLK